MSLFSNCGATYFIFYIRVAFIYFYTSRRHCMGEMQRKFYVPENVTIGTLVGYISHNENGDNDRWSADHTNVALINYASYFFVFPPENQIEQTFFVNEQTGQVKIKRSLDYETKNSYVFLAIPTNGGLGIRVTIDVTDVNDNAPTFVVPKFDVQLPESVKKYSEITLPSATDADVGKYGIQRYEIETGNINKTFSLSTKTLNRLSYLNLILNSELDRETIDSYKLTIKAYDGGDPSLTATLTVNISVLDVNDNPPLFDQNRYVVTLNGATVKKDGYVASVVATDKDRGLNGKIFFDIVDNQNGMIKNYFKIDQNGTITTTTDSLLPPSSSSKPYELVITAKDGGSPPLESTCVVIVNVITSAEEEGFELKVDYANLPSGSAATGTVREDAEIGSEIAKIFFGNLNTDSQPISAINDVNLTLNGGDGKFGLAYNNNNQKDGFACIVLSGRLDREMRANYTLILAGSVPDRTILLTRKLFVRVLDVNDNEPLFTKTLYEASVDENATPGTSVVQISAYDLDEDGPNSNITYTLKPESVLYGGWFEIDGETGLVTTSDSIDCEINSRPEFIVTATDSGTPTALSSTARLVVNILDVNDNAPVLEKSLYNVSLKENVENGTCFIQVQATDPDCGLNAHVRYDILPNRLFRNVFYVNHKTGMLCTLNTLDYELRATYQFSVAAFDGGGLSSSSLIQIYLIDENDNFPVFYPSSYNVSLRQSADPAVPVAILSATDKDSGLFGTITYEITSADDLHLFRVDPKKGELFVQGSLSPTVYHLSITAKDGGNQYAVHPAVVSITVITNDYASPQFEDKFYSINVREDILPGIVLLQTKAYGLEPLSYFIYSGDPEAYFTMERNTGKISVKKYLDHETKNSFLLNIQVASGVPPVFNHTQVKVQVEDVNDNFPVFEQNHVEISVIENQGVKRPLFIASATDKDSGKNGEVRYRLANSNGQFILHVISGELRLNKPLDFEQQQNYTLFITAQDGGIPPLTSNMTLIVRVLDVNDHDPVLVSPVNNFIVSENAKPMTKIGQILASDKDSGSNGRLSYKLIDKDSLPHFGIFGNSGWIYVRKALDRETRNYYTLTVIVRDNGEIPRYANGSVLIKIRDENDNAPNCTTQNQEFFVEENYKPSFIGKIQANDYDAGDNAAITFELKDYKSPTYDLFKINADGELFTEKPLDREETYIHKFFVTVTDKGSPPLSSRCSVIVRVADVNDNAPFFVLPYQSQVFVREQQLAGAEVVQVRASDLDAGDNGVIRYYLEPLFGGKNYSLPFHINTDTGIMTTERVLDYETDPHSFDFYVVAEDQGTPERKRTKKFLSVEVTDIPDGGTVKNVSVKFHVSENLPIGKILGKVDNSTSLAKYDAESIIASGDKFPDIEYSIVSGNIYGIFDIDKSAGLLFTVKNLDYEAQSSHFLIVSKLDSSSRSFTQQSKIEVEISLEDENDNAPEFPEDPVIFSVPENIALNQVVWVYNATDKDTGSFGRIQYLISEQWPESVFGIDSITGEMIVTKFLDFERFSEYITVVEASDQATDESKRRKSQVTTRIYVTDINDNVPSFLSPSEVFVFEDEPAGYPVVHFAATDSDWLENGRVSFSIEHGNNDEKFNLNFTTGVLTLQKRLNRGDPRTFHLQVMAKDHGVPSLSSTQNLVINVLSINSDAPRFEKTSYRANISENSPPGMLLMQLKPLVYSKSDSTDLEFRLFVSNSEKKFNLNEKTGYLTTTAILDREEQAEYVLTAFVKDSSHLQNYDVASIIVTVLDINDNAPRFSNSSCLPFSIPENKKYANLAHIIATDKDMGANGRISYSIENGNTDGKFRIDPGSGQLSCQSLDRETISSYNLTIKATDNGIPALSDVCVLVISISDENDNDPQFDKPGYTFSINENAPMRESFGKVKATDKDDGPNGRVVYNLINETTATFDVNSETGSLHIIRRLDFESKQNYSFFIEAIDQGLSEPRRSIVPLFVSVRDINDNTPVFDQIPIVTYVNSAIFSGQRIVKVSATDGDGPDTNSEIHYELIDRNLKTDSDYAINPVTGVISAKHDMTATVGDVHYLKIMATDNGSPALSSVGIVQILFNDGSSLNDFQPPITFEHKAYTAKLTEHAKKGTEVVKVSAVGPARYFQYTITGGNAAEIFGIETQSGTVFVADDSRLDFELFKEYRLIVQAKSDEFSTAARNGQANLAYVGVKVRLEDTNDHAPHFLQQRYHTTVREGWQKGTFILQVSATDDDFGKNAQIQYGIVGGNLDSAFTIDSNGITKTNAELDREIVDRYVLTILATDYGAPIRSTTTTMEIQVTDVNDNSPSFPPPQLIRIREGTEIGSLITTYSVNDVDSYPALSFSFASSDENWGDYFSLNTFSGRLFLAKALDYETRKEFAFEIQVSDEIHTVTAKQKILVVDENDNAPKFLQNFYQSLVPVGTKSGTQIAQVIASDLDSGQNRKVAYSIGHDSLPGFSIDSLTGAIYINSTVSLEMEYYESIQLIVEARDFGLPPKSSRATVQVQIVSAVYEAQIQFSRNFYNFTIREDAPIHSVVGKIHTKPESKHLTFKIFGDSDRKTFFIDSEGYLVLLNALDRESRDEYRMNVNVQTRVNSVSNSSAVVVVKITDVNDHSPEFEESEYKAEINDSILLNDKILQLSAVDKDVGDNGRIIFEITSGNQDQTFYLEPDTGVLRLKCYPPFRDNSRRVTKLVIKGSDKGQPSKSSFAYVTITYNYSSKNDLFFPLQLYLGRIFENEPPLGVVLFTAKALNKKGDRSIAYSLSGEDSIYFRIEQSSGDVKAAAGFDYETKSSYKFSIVALDDRNRTCRAVGQVLVKGIDEFAPEFTHSLYSFRVPYDLGAGDTAGAVYAKDKDSGVDGHVTFGLREPNSFFAINPSTGMILAVRSLLPFATIFSSNETAKLLTREEQQQFSADKVDLDKHAITLHVVAFSGPDPIAGKTNSTVVVLELSDFSKKQLTGSVSVANTVITVSSVFLILLVIVLLIILLKMRCRYDQPSSANKISYPKRRSNSFKSDLSVYRTAGFARSCALDTAKDVPVKNSCVYLSNKTVTTSCAHKLDSNYNKDCGSSSKGTLPQRRAKPLNSVSNWSAKSSGRGSAVVSDGDDDVEQEIVRLTSRSSSNRSAQNVHSAPDSGIILCPEEDQYSINGGIGADCIPSARQYLLSLGVTGGTSAAEEKRTRNVCTKISGTVDQSSSSKAADVLENYLEVGDNVVVEGVNVRELIYSKINEVLAEDGVDANNLRALPQFVEKQQPSITNGTCISDNLDGNHHLSTFSHWVKPTVPKTLTFQSIAHIIAEAAKGKKAENNVLQNNSHPLKLNGFVTSSSICSTGGSPSPSGVPIVCLNNFPITPETDSESLSTDTRQKTNCNKKVVPYHTFDIINQTVSNNDNNKFCNQASADNTELEIKI